MAAALPSGRTQNDEGRRAGLTDRTVETWLTEQADRLDEDHGAWLTAIHFMNQHLAVLKRVASGTECTLTGNSVRLCEFP